MRCGEGSAGAMGRRPRTEVLGVGLRAKRPGFCLLLRSGCWARWPGPQTPQPCSCAPCGPGLFPCCGSQLWQCSSLPSPAHLEVQLVEGGWQVLGHVSQEVAGQDEDLHVAGAVEHVVRQPGVRQLVVVQVDGPGQGGAGPHPPGPSTAHLVSLQADLAQVRAWGPGHPPPISRTWDPTKSSPHISKGNQGPTHVLVEDTGFPDPNPSSRFLQPWGPCQPHTADSEFCGTALR